MSAPTVFRCLKRRTCSPRIITPTQYKCNQLYHRASIHNTAQKNGAIVPDTDVRKHMYVHSQPSFQDYFSANDSIDRGWLKNGLLATWRSAQRPSQTEASAITASQPNITGVEHEISDSEQNRSLTGIQAQSGSGGAASVQVVEENLEHVLPHRRRSLRKAMTENTRSTGGATPPRDHEQLPFDASSQLTTAATAMPANATFRRKCATYLSLSKPRLSFLIILTTTSAYSLYPIPEILSSTADVVDATTTLSTSTLTLLFLTTGTFLSCASANTFNMLFESKYDALMTRTRNRPLVRKLITPRAAMIFALVCGGSGLLLLDFGTNPTVAALSALNILLYGFVYTPMKRISVANTWIGAIVGAIPPLMGWAAAAGQAATSEHHSWNDLLFSSESVGGWLVAALLFAWQFPHFNSLSYTIRDDYKNAGHKMLAWVDPAKNARVALRYSVAMFPICAGLYWVGVVNSGFLAVSTVCNAWMLREAIKFWKHQGAKGSARGLFWASVWQLPLVLVGALVCKTGIWDGLFEKEQQSIYDPDMATDVIEDEDLAMNASKVLMRGQHDDKAINMAMLGFKRPS